jgi:hypothetical protein
MLRSEANVKGTRLDAANSRGHAKYEYVRWRPSTWKQQLLHQVGKKLELMRSRSSVRLITI